MIKFLHSGMVGAPVQSLTSGSDIVMFDALLVNGFNLQTATSITVAGGVATVGLPSGHGFEMDSVVLVSGAAPVGLNGDQRVMSVTATTITFSTSQPDGTATGTITVKYSPLGWEKVFSTAESVAYRSLDLTSTQMFLSIKYSDAGSITLYVNGYETMSDAVTGNGIFPSYTTPRWIRTSTGPWILVGDSKTLYLLKQGVDNGNLASGAVLGFGDFASFSDVDPYRCFCSTVATSSLTSTTPGGGGNEGTLESVDCDTAYTTIGVPRSRSGTVSPSVVKTLESYMGASTVVVSGGTNNPGGPACSSYPAPANQGLILSRVVLAEGGGPRGYLRGFYGTPQNAHAAFNQMDRVQGQGVLAGRKLMALKCGSPAGTYSQGVVFVDITGPWEG